MTVAIHCSTVEASLREQEHLTEAILRSKIEATPHHGDEVVVSRLTNCSENIFQTLFESDNLIPCISRVVEAECEVQPKWANGAVLLAPLMHEDLSGKDIELRNFHVVHYRRDVTLIKQALAKIPKRQDRPKENEERDAKISRKGGMSDVVSCSVGNRASFGSFDFVIVQETLPDHQSDSPTRPIDRPRFDQTDPDLTRPTWPDRSTRLTRPT